MCDMFAPADSARGKDLGARIAPLFLIAPRALPVRSASPSGTSRRDPKKRIVPHRFSRGCGRTRIIPRRILRGGGRRESFLIVFLGTVGMARSHAARTIIHPYTPQGQQESFLVEFLVRAPSILGELALGTADSKADLHAYSEPDGGSPVRNRHAFAHADRQLTKGCSASRRR
jgi:hypothetical protein